MSDAAIIRQSIPDQKLLYHARFPRNLGRIPSPSGWARGVGQCGDSVEVAILVNENRISDIKVVPNGCIYTMVCASALSELATGRTIERALELGPEDVEQALGGLPEDHLHCARLAVNSLGEAIADYYQKAIAAEVSRRPSGL